MADQRRPSATAPAVRERDGMTCSKDDQRRRRGVPPKGNADFARMPHVVRRPAVAANPERIGFRGEDDR